VAGRVDVGSVRITKDELTKICAERGYAGQFVTSAKSGEGCAELRSAVLSSIQWSNLPTTRSPTIFKRIKDFLTTLREGNRILVQEQQIYREFCEIEELDAPSQQEFTTVIGHVENVGLIELLSFGDIVLLKPELLNSYSSAVIDAARRNTAGLGFVRKSAVLNGEITLKETGGLNETEQVLLLHATAELFLRLGLALEQDEHLVFPSKLNRRMPPIPRGSAWDSTVTFDGPAEAVYSTLVVKLFLGKLFTLKKLWKNAAEFASPAGTSCGFQVTSRDDGSSLLRVFISNGIPASDRALLTTVTLEHFRDRQVEAKFQRFHRCSKCGEQARDRQALVRALEKGRTKIPCQYCSGVVDLREDVSRMVGSKSRYIEQANSIDIEAKAAMKRSGDLVAASAEIRSSRFLDWVGGANLANVSIVFADIVDSTSLNNSMGDAAWGEIRDEYFRRAYDLVEEHEGYLIKTIGDAVMVAFHNSLKALDFSLSIHQNPGHVSIRVNVGIHTGQVQIADNDAFGQHVNMAARVASFAKGSSIAVSARVRDDILSFDPRRRIRWKEHPCVSLKGFNDAFTLWSVERTGE
jgi:class 3 adenylate cyclase/DNA-directed RNA polymerase subunit RPC12/RpoP